MNYRSPLVALLLLLGGVHRARGEKENAIVFTMPHDGWATVAIDDANGRRVRNLFGDLHFTKGEHAVEWDGRDDDGNPVPPGDYRWLGLHRDAMHALYRGSFQYGNPPWLYGSTGGWLADHSSATAVAAVGDRVLLGSNEAEDGHGLVSSDLDGHKQWGVRWLAKRAWAGAEALAVVGERVFANSYLEQNAVWEVDPVTGKSWLVMEKTDLPSDQTNTEPRPPCTFAPGLRVIGGHQGADGTNGELYVVDLFGKIPRTYVFSLGKSGEKLKLQRVLPVRPWGVAWLPDGRCVAALENSIAVLDTSTGETKPLVSDGLSAPYAIATDAKGRIYVSDQGNTGMHRFTSDGQMPWRALRLNGESSQQIKIFDAKGRQLRAIGLKGGRQPGHIDPNSFWQPGGIAVDARGRLWVTEFTTSPKRVSVWEIPNDLAATAPKLTQQFLGPAMYGGGAAMIDPTQPWRVIDTNYGVIFDVNLTNGSYQATDLPWRAYDSWKEHAYQPDLPFMGTPGVVFPLDGRRFTACQGGYGHGAQAHWEPEQFNGTGPVMIGEYKDDKFVPEAAIGNLRTWMRNRELECRREEQWMPPVILEAARKLPAWPKYAAQMHIATDASDVPHSIHPRNSGIWIANPWPKEISGFLWTDANGDGRVQTDEIQFHEIPDAETVTLDHQLNAYMPVRKEHGGGVYRLQRSGFNAIGAPVYKWDNLTKVTDDSFNVDQVGDDGSMLSFGALHSAQGKLLWSYPINPKGLRELGPAKRAVTYPGHVFRINSMQGVAQGPGDLGPVYMLHSVDGMSYFLTRNDGLFIATMFRPYAFGDNWDTIPEAKAGMELDRYTVGEECFNGHFARAEATGQGFEKGHYYLLGMGRSAVVELTGLNSVQRFSGGTLKLVAGVGLFGKGGRLDPGAAAAQIASTGDHPKPGPLIAPSVIPKTDAFRGEPAQFASATVWPAWDKRGLHLKWSVTGDDSPFINNEPDWTLAFTTGDAADLQIKSPTLGRCRFVITMNAGQPVVVRLRYDAADSSQGVTYKSGVAETRVPLVEKLSIPVGVRRTKDSYNVQLTLPWDLLGIDPKPGLSVPFELGAFYSDPTGHKTAIREYWHSGVSGMVSDVPTEARPTDDWGTLQLQ
ncbi:NHL repeat containing protein [Chthoniobacter flavus Ellin428]|uniref:NHL repeat containing protein n=1 Tax=Chthoniobacter flavus Ellin428 TaxID=497964 RepID=B4D817_9BACT|nr:FlgD immunoglobulin-like domain containing protein [Chthoniobacter flavus]EDY17371.1 NHL repeat containing protein [Chthoniobacter flavus Ellin428]TCO87379.1 FlgD-like protein [Chthoniobacter flavus]